MDILAPSVVPLLSSCGFRRIKYLIYRIIWNDVEISFQCFVSTVQKYDLKVIKSCLPRIFVSERDTETTVIKKTKQFIFFNCGDIQLSDVMISPGGATRLDSFLNAFKFQKQKDVFPTIGLITLTKCTIQNLPRMMPSTVNFVAVILLKQNKTAMLFY